MNKYISRVTSSARGETFNPLTWPYLFSTLAYGVGFLVLATTKTGGSSALYTAMAGFYEFLPIVWGIIAILNIIGGLTFMLFNIPPFGKASGLVGFMLWVFAAFCFGLTGSWVLFAAVALPNMFFWIWQYLSLTKFRHQDAADRATLERYERGGYDNVDPNVDSEQDRLNNRGVDEQ